MTPPRISLSHGYFFDSLDIGQPPSECRGAIHGALVGGGNQVCIGHTAGAINRAPTGWVAGFRIPKIFLGAPASLQPPQDASWTADHTGKLVRDLLISIESMDLEFQGLPVHGGQAGCRYSEVVSSEEFSKAKCVNKFEKDTHATLRAEVRPLKGLDVSELYRLYVNYDKAPGRTGVNVGGFFVTHPLNKNAEGPLHVSQEDPFEGGKDFRDAVRPSFDVPMGTRVPYSADPSLLMMRPQGWMYDDAPVASFDITKNTLLANGLIQKNFYEDLGVEAFKIPRRLDQLVELFSHVDGCYPKRPKATVKQPNFEHDLPSLFELLSPTKAHLEIQLRSGKISLGPFGYIQFGDKAANKIKIEGDDKQTKLEIEIGDLADVQLNQGGYQFTAKGLKTGKITLLLPSIHEMAKEFALLEKETAEVIKARCVDPAAHPKPKKDHSAYLEKIFGKIEFSNLSADELAFEFKERGVKARIVKPEIRKVEISGSKKITLEGLKAEEISVQDPATKFETKLIKGGIESVVFERLEGGPRMTANQLLSPEWTIGMEPVDIKIEQGAIGKVSLDASIKDRLAVNLEKAKSKGTLQYKNSAESTEITSTGTSEIASFTMVHEKDSSGETKISSALNFSGEIQSLGVSHPQLGEFTLKDTKIGASILKLDFKLPVDPKAKMETRFQLDLGIDRSRVDGGHIRFVDLGESSLKNGKITLNNLQDKIAGLISGDLNLNFKKIEVPLIEVLLKGFTIEGTLKDVSILGEGTLELSPTAISLQKNQKAPAASSLKIAGSFEKLHLTDDPSQRNHDLKKTPGGKAVKSSMTIEQAKVEVADLEEFHFIQGNAAQGIKPDLAKLKVNQFSISNIQASGKIWANFPIFGWLKGTFPKIGAKTKSLPSEVLESEIRFDSLETHREADGKVATLTNLLIQLFEVEGRKQFARFKLPFLFISPSKIDTGKEPMELEVYFKDKDRGGDFEFDLKDEDLSKRRRRPAPKK